MPNLTPLEIAALIAAFVSFDLLGLVIWRNRLTLQKLVKDCVTENDGQSYDVTRVIVALVGSSALPTLIGCTIYSVYANPDHHFNAVDFGTAVGLLLTGLCAAAIGIAQKQKTDT